MKALAIVLLVAASLPALAEDPAVKGGRYLICIAGCNDCHTPNFAASGGG